VIRSREQTRDYIAYEMSHADAVSDGLIRDVDFEEEKMPDSVDDAEDPRAVERVIERMARELDEHDEAAQKDNRQEKYQGMILCHTKDFAEAVCALINANVQRHGKAVTLHGDTSKGNLKKFTAGDYRFLVTCGKACEGYDNKKVSVVGVLRNITARVLFTQFVGRCVRKLYPTETIHGKIVSLDAHKQRKLYEGLNELAEDNPTDEAAEM